jgi:hypothetical protein
MSSAPPRTEPSQSSRMPVPRKSYASHSPQVRSSGAQLNSPHCYRRNRVASTGVRFSRQTSVTRLPFHALPQSPADAKRPPGNWAAFSLGRIVPTEAKPSELSGCILSLAKTGVKAKTMPMQHHDNKLFIRTRIIEDIRLIFAFTCPTNHRSTMKSNIYLHNMHHWMCIPPPPPFPATLLPCRSADAPSSLLVIL